ncbi:ATP-dependent helicase [Geobacillus sp. NFOSA3]|nr:UvrD-helicase domain-containing protein [Parageobacillus toebii]NNU94772.1 ATP-dependent helicase [Geobacillus sp. NFOSA3]PDM38959.1 ATP-dependent helicase [Parageobacillus yumthangensis]PUF90296.1 ATP-dependent helicase [Geobacillus sp. LYN3]TXK87262.1 ATP-dependent helicase [Geobacillus sp. AYS3]TXK90616.1 ATP-dependent helicase [Parageobacillus sp. SY1]
MQMTADLHKKRLDFAKKSARAWQNYFDAHGLLPNITLSPEQISVVQQEEDQMLINGSAGTGKSLTLIYKLLKVMEQENEPKRILYCSFNTTLIEDARKRIEQSHKFHEIKDKHTLHMKTFHNMATGILREIGFKNTEFLRVNLENLRRYEDTITRRTIALVDSFMESEEYKRLPPEQKLYKTHTGTFLMDEILWMKANGFITEESYYNCERVGRGNIPRLTKEQRRTIFYLYKKYQELLKKQFHDHLDLEDYALLLLKHFEDIPESLKYDYIFVDEVQDLQAMQLKALVGLTKKSIVVSGDPKQRIYKRSPFSYRDLGLYIEGRKTRNLRTNYRSTKQIMKLASSLQFLDEENDRLDDQRFVREGKKPSIYYFRHSKELTTHLVDQIRAIQKHDSDATIAVVHRHDADKYGVYQCPVFNELNRNFDVITTSQYARRFELNKQKKPIFFTDAFSVKGLEFDYVFLIHFDRDHYPNKKRIEELDQRAGDNKDSDSYNADLDTILNDEKKVLYVAITRAKKEVQLMYTGKNFRSISPFVRDFYKEDYDAFGFDSSIYSNRG